MSMTCAISSAAQKGGIRFGLRMVRRRRGGGKREAILTISSSMKEEKRRLSAVPSSGLEKGQLLFPSAKGGKG